MNEKTSNRIFFAFIAVIFIVKLLLVMQTPTISYDSYYELRYIEHVHNTFTPLINDPLSYQGRVFFVNIIYYLSISIITFIIPAIIFLKYMSLFLGLFAIYLLYKILMRLFANKWIVLSMSILAALLPTLFTSYFNTFSSGLLFWVLFLATIYFFPDIEKSKGIKGFITVFILAAIISPYSLILVLGFLTYFLLLRLESMPIKQSSLEVLLFTILFTVWYHLIFYKTALTRFGLSVLWQNMPDLLIQYTYQKLTVITALVFIGLVPLVLGLFGMYHVLFTKRNRLLLLVSSFVLVLSLFLAIGILPLYDGLILLISSLILLSANGLDFIMNYFDKTLIPKTKILVIVAVILVSLFNVIPILGSTNMILSNSPNSDEVKTMEFIKQNIPSHETVLGDVDEGHFLSSQGGVKNFYDTNFFLIPTADQRFKDSKTMFLSRSKVAIIEQMDYYDIEYVYISKKTRARYNTNDFLIRTDECFDKIFGTKTTEVYKRKCDI